jgi:hypothetical protein
MEIIAATVDPIVDVTGAGSMVDVLAGIITALWAVLMKAVR